jgi:DNA-binding TFAR19-related protein (PDSD5 family)
VLLLCPQCIKSIAKREGGEKNDKASKTDPRAVEPQSGTLILRKDINPGARRRFENLSMVSNKK